LGSEEDDPIKKLVSKKQIMAASSQVSMVSEYGEGVCNPFAEDWGNGFAWVVLRGCKPLLHITRASRGGGR
jgi:hypothetical protein